MKTVFRGGALKEFGILWVFRPLCSNGPPIYEVVQLEQLSDIPDIDQWKSFNRIHLSVC